ncbi:MAG: hypothetical protein OXI69_15570 [Acidobacteriota bacterium]|nr:hypothetical protein [Acidobacteriota bacterium]
MSEHRKIVEINADNICFHEFDYRGREEPVLAANHVDVTGRTDGPFLGKVYDRNTDAWSDPPKE